jgi:hypothetical protein
MSTIKEKLQAIKALFNTTPPPAPNANAPQTHTGTPSATNLPTGNPMQPQTKQADMIANVVGYPIDGLQPIYTDISDDSIAGLDANDYVFTDEMMSTPYADGNYTVTGTDFSFTVSGGQIVSIDNPSGMGCGEPLADIDEPVEPVTIEVPEVVSPESMKQMCEKFAVGTPEERIANLEKIVKLLFEYNYGWQLREAEQKAQLNEATVAYNTLKTQFSKQEAFSKEVLELVELVANQSTASPTTLPENKKEGFVAKKEAQIAKMAEAIKEAKSKQKFS